MPGLVPGIHVLCAAGQGVDGRVKPGHDDGEASCVPKLTRS
ncbi:ABC transporter [Bradyrhizobium zhanjiangense]|uniref:ABC transporter n=1 Tax=Bradyrhizobium zhanjiangense TaxID=1325107 RepID=A0A4Q0R004_9BRAD|nr:ABC transporter [Bradyrhizobium zhanjiangense]